MRSFGNEWYNKKMDLSMFLFNVFLTLTLFLTILPNGITLASPGATLVMDQDIPLKRCRYSKAYSMFQVTCTKLELKEIPRNLKTDIQILDASVNRVRKLTNKSLAPYKSLAYLYLAENFIQTIEDDAFANQQYLEVLDLSTNGCTALPRNLFTLPYLRKLYLSDNKLTDSVFKVDVSSPLNFLQLSQNSLCKIPELGPLPSLMHLNVSENTIRRITTEDLAPFCSLKELDFSGNPIEFDAGSCDCQVMSAWLKTRGIRSKPEFNCTAEKDNGCTGMEFSNRTTELYENCSSILRLRIETEQARNTWTLVACCVGAFLFCLFVALFCVHKRNKKRKRRLKEEQRIAVNNANTELLNSNLNRPENT